MWLLIECDNQIDVSEDEKQRYVLSEHLSIVTRLDGITAVLALGKRVYPLKEL